MVKRVNDWHEQQKLKEPPQIMQNAFGQGSQASSVILSNFRESPTGSLYSGKEETPKFASDKPNELLIKIKKLVSNSQKVTSEMLNFDPTQDYNDQKKKDLSETLSSLANSTPSTKVPFKSKQIAKPVKKLESKKTRPAQFGKKRY